MTGNENKEYAGQWVVKAEHDLVTAERTLSMETPPTDTPCFHAQQAVEKSLKALLTLRGIEFPRTHDRLVLLDIVNTLTDEFAQFRTMLAEINSYAIEARYPGDCVDPSIDDASQAVRTARSITEIVKAMLSQ